LPVLGKRIDGVDMNQQHAAPADKGSPDDRSRGQTRTSHDQSVEPQATGTGGRAGPRVEPSLPHEADESSRSQASASPRHREIGRQAMEDELSPSEDTDRGPVLDKVYHEKVATDRGHTPPRR
jgi:hypothetical protein